MDLDVFRQARDVAKNRLEEVEQESLKLEHEKLTLQATVASLDELLDEGEPNYSSAFATALENATAGVAQITSEWADALDPLNGLTESCRFMMNMIPNTGMQVSEVVRMLEERGFNFANYSNRLSAVHTVLNRLCKKGEAKIAGRTSGGRPLYAPTSRSMPRREEASPRPVRGRVDMEEPIGPYTVARYRSSEEKK
jgi:hypothetical protein